MKSNLRTGFTLIEMMIVLMLSAIVIGIMLSSYSQLQKTTQIFDSRVNLESNVLAITSLFERDISGACIPLQAYQSEKEKRAEEESKKPTAATQQALPNQAITGEAEAKEAQQKTPEIKALFYAEQGDANVTILFTCITNNPLELYWSEGAGYPKPKIARVVYRLKKNESPTKAPYSLWRQEGSDLDFALYTKSDSPYRQYLVSDAVSRYALSFSSYEVDKDGKAQEKTSQLEYGSNQEMLLDIPQLASLEITVRDPRQKRDQSFSATYRVWGQAIEVPAKKEAPRSPSGQAAAATPNPS